MSDKRNYYVFQGFNDGSGKPGGYIIKSYTDKEANDMIKYGYSLIKIENSYDNTDYIINNYKLYNVKYIKRSPIAKKGEGKVLDSVELLYNVNSNGIEINIVDKTKSYLFYGLLSNILDRGCKTIIINGKNNLI